MMSYLFGRPVSFKTAMTNTANATMNEPQKDALTRALAVGISKSTATMKPVAFIDEDGKIVLRLSELADIIIKAGYERPGSAA